MSEAHEINLDSARQGSEGYGDEREMITDALDRASDQGQRTWVRYGGKRIAMIVTVDDGERLEKLEPDCICLPGADWRDDCPRHGHRGCAATQAYGATGCT